MSAEEKEAPEIEEETPKRVPIAVEKPDTKKPRQARKPKSKKREIPPPPHWSAEEFAQQVEGLHQLAATITQDPNLAMAPDKAAMMGAAIHNTFETYDLWYLLRSSALIELALAVAVAEGPIIMYVIQKGRQKRADKRQQQTNKDPNVTVVPPPEGA